MSCDDTLNEQIEGTQKLVGTRTQELSCILFFSMHTVKKMLLYSTKTGSWLVIIGEPLLVLYSTISLKVIYLCQMVLCRTIRGATLHRISSTKMVLNSTNSGSLARKEPLKELNRFFVRQWCYIAP